VLYKILVKRNLKGASLWVDRGSLDISLENKYQ